MKSLKVDEKSCTLAVCKRLDDSTRGRPLDDAHCVLTNGEYVMREMEEFKEELEEGKDAANAGMFVTVPFVNAPSLASLIKRDQVVI